MEIKKVNYALVVYLALIEGLSLFVLEVLKPYPINAILGLIVGFVPAVVVLAIYKVSSESFPVKLNGKDVTKLPILYLSVLNAIFIEVLFLIQNYLPALGGLFGSAVFGLLSVLIASLLLIMVYNMANVKLNFELNHKELKVTHLDLTTSVYAGIFEFFIMPVMVLFYSLNLFSLINGLVSGFVGSLIALWIVNKILEKKPLELL